MPSKREQLLEIMEDAAKGETKATLRARIAELGAEVERLTRDRDYWKTEAAGERAKVEYRDRIIAKWLGAEEATHAQND